MNERKKFFLSLTENEEKGDSILKAASSTTPFLNGLCAGA
jgi:hypothetical protein